MRETGLLLGRHRTVGLLVGTAIFLVLCSGKAVSVDDPLFIWLAQHVSADPKSFFGFDVNWYGTDSPMWTITRNPPLSGYYLAVFGTTLGWSERVLHLALLGPALVVIAITLALARRFAIPPGASGLLLVLSPAFLVTATNLGCDMLMLAFWCAAVQLWIDGLGARTSRWRLVAAGCLAGLAVLTKYFAIALVPLLLLYGWRKRGRIGIWALPLGLPVLVLLIYQWYTHHLYGIDLFSDAMRYAVRFDEQPATFGSRILIACTFAGGAMIALVAYALVLLPRRWRIGWMSATVLGALLSPLILPPLGIHSSGGGPWFHAQTWIFAAGGAACVDLCVRELRQRRDAESLLLVAWTLGTFFFAGFMNWTNNGRSILPLTPAVALLVARRLQETGIGMRARSVVYCGLAMLSVGATWADVRWANAVRDAARALTARYVRPGYHVFFQGHWGFQYYMQEAGGIPLDFERQVLNQGDLLIAPSNNYFVPAWDLGPDLAERVEEYVPSGTRWWSTMAPDMGAAFYASSRGPLPFAIGPAAPDRYLVVQIRAPLRFDLPAPPSSR